MGYRRLPDIALPTREGDVAYLAGLIDGEGHITVARAFDRKSVNVSHSIRVVVTNTNKPIIDWLSEMSHTAPVVKKGAKANWKDAWNWQVTGRNAETLLRAVLPWLRIKRQQAELCLELRDLGRHAWSGRGGLDPELVAAREAIAQQVNDLNQRGVPVHPVL
jgi:hypothetical protein